MMDVRWTLNIENFGKIERAKIEISPMMLFVGDNNSGKSYVMSLLWGVLSYASGLFDYRAFETSEYKTCEEWFKKQRSSGDVIAFDSEIKDHMLKWFNVLLDRDKEKIVERVFSYPLSIGNISISDFREEVPIIFRIVDDEDPESYEHTIAADAEVYYFPEKMESKVILALLCKQMFIRGILQYRDPLYLPASRTGFMLTYKTLLANLIDPMGYQLNPQDASQYKSEFPIPVTRFLRLLVQTSISQHSPYLKVAEFIERNIMSGELRKDSSPVPNFLFKPNGGQDDLPLHVTSSLVSELSPIVMFLKSEQSFSPFIIEEPEAHLHLRMQKLLTTALVRLVNQGLPIWLTTHSDTVLQQVNNMIKLFNHTEKVRLAVDLGYETEFDPVNPDHVRAYQFSVQADGSTVIEPLKLTQYGFVAPTFNETLVNLTDETLKLQESEEDAD